MPQARQLTPEMIAVDRPDNASPSTPSVTLVGEPARRLLELARLRGVDVGELLEELTAMALFDAAASGCGAPRAAPARPASPL